MNIIVAFGSFECPGVECNGVQLDQVTNCTSCTDCGCMDRITGGTSGISIFEVMPNMSLNDKSEVQLLNSLLTATKY